MKPVRIVGPEGPKDWPCCGRAGGLAVARDPTPFSQDVYSLTHESSGRRIALFSRRGKALAAMRAAAELLDWTESEGVMAKRAEGLVGFLAALLFDLGAEAACGISVSTWECHEPAWTGESGRVRGIRDAKGAA